MKHADQHTGRVGVLPWFAACVVAAALIFMNLDGYHNELFEPISRGHFWGEPPSINWTHGWPTTFMGRPSIYSLSAGIAAPTPGSLRHDDMGMTSRWLFDQVPIFYFRAYVVCIDAATFLVLVFGTAFGAQRAVAKRPIKIQFSLKLLFVVTTVVAIALAFKLPLLLPRYIPQFLAMGIAALGAAITVFGVADLIWTRLRRSS